MSGAWAQHQYGIIFFLVVVLVVVLTNLRYLGKLGARAGHGGRPYVSVLVPARNEEDNIEACVRSLLEQEYDDFEVLVLDDCSTDRTGAILDGLAGEHPRLTVLRGEPPPAGWMGKHWACSRLASMARGELILFTDADTRHAPDTLGAAVAELNERDLCLLTAFPAQEVVSIGEKVAVPILGFSILAFIPLGLAYRRWPPGLAAAVGQFMLFRREAYEAVGGHAAVNDYVADDFALARRVKAAGMPWRFYEATGLVSCRMYRNLRQVIEGLSKNLFSAFGNRVLLFLFVWCWLGVVFLEPPLVLLMGSAGLFNPEAGLVLAGVEVALSLAAWFVAMRRLRFPAYTALLYPAIIAVSIVIAFNSFRLTLKGRTSWKGRTLARPRIRP